MMMSLPGNVRREPGSPAGHLIAESLSVAWGILKLGLRDL
jgi:hypothetical protein